MKHKKMLLLIMFLVVGFASISTILKINGSTTISENRSDFDIFFSSAILNGEEHNEFISSDGKNINFGLAELKNVNSEVVLEYEITNSSSQYDADVNLLFNNLDVSSEYLEITKTDNYGNSILAKGKGTGTIRIKLIKPVVENEDVDLNLNLGIDAKEKDIDSLDPDYSPDIPKKSEISFSGVIKDPEGNPKKDKVVVIETPNGLLYTKTDLEGNIYQDNLPEGTFDVYILDEHTTEEVKNMTIEEIKETADGHIKLTTKTHGNQNGDNINVSNIDSFKTEDKKVVEITIGDTVIKKNPNGDNEVIFNVDSNESKINISGLGEKELVPGENRFEITLENGETVTIVINNVKPTPPELSEGAPNYVSRLPIEITIEKEGSALSDIDHYEYIISDREITNFDNITPTGTTDNILSIDSEGTKYIYYRTVSKNGTTSSWSKPSIVKIDTSSPIVTIRETTSTSNSINIRFDATDTYSGIKEITCKYGNNLSNNGVISNGVCSLSGLEKDTIYDYKICASDNAGNKETCKSGTAGTKIINNPKITFEGEASSASGYYLGQTAVVTFNKTNIASPTYYIKSTRNGTSNIPVIGICGSSSYPSTCTQSSTTKIEANKWYQVSESIRISYTESYDEFSQLIAVSYDGTNYSGLTTGTIGKIAYRAIDIEYSSPLAPNVSNVQEAIDDLYKRLK